MLARLDAAQASRPMPAPDGGAAARRDVEAGAGAAAARAGRPRDPGQPAAHGAGARRLLPRSRPNAPSSRRSRRTASRSAARCRCSILTRPINCWRCARSRSTPMPTPTRRCPTTTSNCSPSRLSGLGFYIEAVEQQRPRPRAADRAVPGQAPGRGGSGVGAGRPPTRPKGRCRVAQCVADAGRRSPSRARRRRTRARRSRASCRSCATTPS